jgi:beta-N-acetylhexosaminidase
LGLHLQAKDQSHLPGPSTDVRAREITQRAPTLVKDIKKIHPVTPVKYRKIYLYQTSIVQPIIGDRTFEFADLLRKEGFEVTVHEDGPGGMSAFQNHDLVMYVMGEETIATRERIYMNWLKLTGSFGAAMQRPWHDLPAMLISFGYPYYLYDSPRLPCVVNAYAAMDSMQEAVIECLVGRAEYQGRSPVDPFCGLIDARY